VKTAEGPRRKCCRASRPGLNHLLTQAESALSSIVPSSSASACRPGRPACGSWRWRHLLDVLPQDSSRCNPSSEYRQAVASNRSWRPGRSPLRPPVNPARRLLADLLELGQLSLGRRRVGASLVSGPDLGQPRVELGHLLGGQRPLVPRIAVISGGTALAPRSPAKASPPRPRQPRAWRCSLRRPPSSGLRSRRCRHEWPCTDP